MNKLKLLSLISVFTLVASYSVSAMDSIPTPSLDIKSKRSTKNLVREGKLTKKVLMKRLKSYEPKLFTVLYKILTGLANKEPYHSDISKSLRLSWNLKEKIDKKNEEIDKIRRSSDIDYDQIKNIKYELETYLKSFKNKCTNEYSENFRLFILVFLNEIKKIFEIDFDFYNNYNDLELLELFSEICYKPGVVRFSIFRYIQAYIEGTLMKQYDENTLRNSKVVYKYYYYYDDNDIFAPTSTLINNAIKKCEKLLEEEQQKVLNESVYDLFG